MLILGNYEATGMVYMQHGADFHQKRFMGKVSWEKVGLK